MPLEEYRRKRDFQKTPEPAGAVHLPPGGSRFVVQMHDARRLHYDFRLEIDGVLKSWAIPKGPSLNPTDKRLAVMTEDHPLDYADFEGVIPEGHYGAGPVMVWDTGTFELEGPLSGLQKIAKGELKFSLHGRRLRGGFALVKLKGAFRDTRKNEWLLIKHRDEASDPSWNIEKFDTSVLSGRTIKEIEQRQPLPPTFAGELDGARRARMPARLEPMLATLTSKAFSGPDWLFELKWDGMRVLGRVEDGQYDLWSRRGRSAKAQFPELSVLPERLSVTEAIVDGEIVVLEPDGRPSFERMQGRMHTERPSAALLTSAPIVYYLFDIPYCDGFDLRAVPLIERKQFLRRILDVRPPLRYCDHVREQGRDLYEAAKEKGLEGVIGKRMDSAYVSGRSADWVKLKVTQELEAVIGGYTAAQGSQPFGALLLGLYDDGRLRYIGRVGTGFTHKTQASILARLKPLRADRSPFAGATEPRLEACWVKPEVVARIKYGEWTHEKRLRAPVFLGLRDDIDATECRFEVSAPSPDPPPRPRSVSSSPVVTRWEDVLAELEGGSAAHVVVELDGKSTRLSNLNKVYFPKEGYTKRDVLAYYARCADLVLPFLRQRPLVLRRTPDGAAGEQFFQKDAGDDAPPWIETIPIRSEEKGKVSRFFVANDVMDLLFLTNLGCIEHNAWSSPVGDLERPDYVFFDLDPVEGTKYTVVVEVARAILKVLDRIGLQSFLKTSGATGFHMYVPLERIYSYEDIRAFVEIIARMMAERMPQQVTLERTVSKRPVGKIYIDYSQNGYGRPLTIVYSARPFAGAPVSTPVTSRELTADLDPGGFTIKTVPARVKKTGDLWGDFWKSRQRLEPALARLQKEMNPPRASARRRRAS